MNPAVSPITRSRRKPRSEETKFARPPWKTHQGNGEGGGSRRRELRDNFVARIRCFSRSLGCPASLPRKSRLGQRNPQCGASAWNARSGNAPWSRRRISGAALSCNTSLLLYYAILLDAVDFYTNFHGHSDFAVRIVYVMRSSLANYLI